MFRSFFTTAVRHLIKSKSYALLNIFGLSVGLACFTLIALWVKDEISYDKFHSNADRIYRVGGLFTDESGKFDQAVTPPPLAPALISDLPEVEDAVRVDKSDAVVRLDEKQFAENGILAVDQSFFNVFSFKITNGDKKSLLTEPYTVVLSESMAKKYFGDADPVGKSLRMFLYDPDGQGMEYKITGVIEDCPKNSHLNYNFLISFKTHDKVYPDALTADGWFWNGYYTYVLLKSNASAFSLQAKFPSFLEKYMGARMKEWKIRYDYFLTSLTDIHLKSHLRYEIEPTSSVSYVMIFGTIGFIVLLLACINYINLSTAYSAKRFKEVGVRKVMGAFKHQLIKQYLVESWILAMISLLVAVTWIELARPLFESLTGKQITNLYHWQNLLSLFTIASVVGLLSGVYPSLVLSSFKTINILKGQFKTGVKGVWLRKSLVVLQYSITIVLITGILIVQLQLGFIQDKDLGFNKENLVVLGVNGSREVVTGFEGFQHELLQDPSIKGIARSNSMIANGLGNAVATAEDVNGKMVNSTAYRLRIDHNYFDVYGMKMIAGRNFMEGNASDSSRGFVVNEATAKVYGYTDPKQMVGKPYSFGGINGEVIGVVGDFHYNSLQHKVEPTAVFLLNRNFSRISVRVSGDVHANIEKIASAWKKHFPQSVFEYSFAEDTLSKQYQSEQRFSKIFMVFSGISLVIACLGLFSLVSYSVEGRTKEIGIRKVLGASVAGIVTMLSSEFLLLIIISCGIAIPVAWYFMDSWLQGFAYHVSITYETFIVAAVIAFVVALLTISIKSVRSALMNPVNSLRNE